MAKDTISEGSYNMSKTIYSNDGEIRIYIRKNKRFDTIQLIKAGKKLTAKERKRATTENIEYYKKEGIKAWNKLTTPQEVQEVKTLKDFYLTAFKTINRAVNQETAKDKIRRFEKYVLPYLGNKRIDKISALQVEEWQTTITKLYGANQARRVKRLLRAVLNRAIIYELIDKNVVTIVSAIREPRTEGREVYTREEISKMLEYSTGQLHLFILTMVSLGLRSSEIIVIRFSDIDFKKHTIKIQRTMRMGRMGTTKTGISRTIEIPNVLLKEFEKAYRNYQESLSSYTFMTPPNQEGYIFTSKNNTCYKDCSYINRRFFKPLLERLNIPYKTLYSLRHTYATLSLQGGQDVAYISKQLGHCNIRTTIEHYIKYLEDKETIKRANDIFSFNQQNKIGSLTEL